MPNESTNSGGNSGNQGAAGGSSGSTQTPSGNGQGASGTGASSAGGSSSASVSNTSSASWLDTLPSELKGYVENKGFKAPSDIVESYRNLEKNFGVPKERLVKLPEKADDPAWNDVYKQLGRPEKPDEYGIAPPKDADPGFANWAKETFYNAGLSRKQAEVLSGKWEEFVKTETEKAQAKATDQFKAEQEALRREWGHAYDQNMRAAKAAFNLLGQNSEAVDKLQDIVGYAPLMKFMQSVGEKVGEDTFSSSDSHRKFGNAMSPDAARSKIQELTNDANFRKRLLMGDVDAKEEWSRVNKYAVVPSENV